jgi:selenocysteine lyase/cysteine desulfurase
MKAKSYIYRENFPVLRERVYLDNAGAGIPPLSVTESMHSFLKEWSREGEKWENWLRDVVELRRKFASEIGASEKEIAVVPSVSFGLASLASSLNLRRKKVIVSELNFPTNILLWQRMKERGLLKEVQILQAQEGKVHEKVWKEAIDDSTLLVAVDYVSWFNGYRENVAEIAELAHRKGALVVVDCFHAMGVFPFDVKSLSVDVLVTGFYKWICGPHGVACLYVSKELLENSEPSYIGWHGIEDSVAERVMKGRDPFDVPFNFKSARPSKSASRYEWGTWASVVVKGAIEAVNWMRIVTPANRFRIISELRDYLLEKLQELGFKLVTPSKTDSLAGIVTFKTDDHVKMVEKLRKRGVVVSGRYNHIRVSPHFYNTYEDIQELLNSLKL